MPSCSLHRWSLPQQNDPSKCSWHLQLSSSGELCELSAEYRSIWLIAAIRHIQRSFAYLVAHQQHGVDGRSLILADDGAEPSKASMKRSRIAKPCHEMQQSFVGNFFRQLKLAVPVNTLAVPLQIRYETLALIVQTAAASLIPRSRCALAHTVRNVPSKKIQLLTIHPCRTDDQQHPEGQPARYSVCRQCACLSSVAPCRRPETSDETVKSVINVG